MKKALTLILFLLAFGWSSSNSSPAASESVRSRVPTTQEARELLSVICKRPKGTTTEYNLQESTCKPCPYDLELGMNGDFVVKLKIETVLYGRFLNTKETNALVDTSQCEASDNNFGGTIILRWLGSGNWEFVRYEPGNRSNDCFKYKANAGHDLRVCRVSLKNVALRQVERFAFFDETLPSAKTQYPVVANAAARGEALVQVISNLEDCDNLKVDDFQVVRNESKDLNRDGRSDFRLQVSERHAQRPTPGDCSQNLQWSKTKTLMLEFLFDGTKFNATPATKKVVTYLNSFKS
jgi:hypothetical protein